MKEWSTLKVEKWIDGERQACIAVAMAMQTALFDRGLIHESFGAAWVARALINRQTVEEFLANDARALEEIGKAQAHA